METILTNIKERILYYTDFRGFSKEKFFSDLGVTYGNFKGKAKEKALSSDILAKIVSKYPELNPNWLLTGDGNMLKGEEIVTTDITDGVPFWNLPVSAGKSIADITGGITPDGYIKGLPGADISENILPVTGTSMEPEISAGALIGIRKISNWETLNTERIYFIITQDDRMIKRIEPDAEDDSILWCVSPNYPKFKIYKTDIIEIQRVCFVYDPK